MYSVKQKEQCWERDFTQLRDKAFSKRRSRRESPFGGAGRREELPLAPWPVAEMKRDKNMKERQKQVAFLLNHTACAEKSPTVEGKNNNYSELSDVKHERLTCQNKL